MINKEILRYILMIVNPDDQSTLRLLLSIDFIHPIHQKLFLIVGRQKDAILSMIYLQQAIEQKVCKSYWCLGKDLFNDSREIREK